MKQEKGAEEQKQRHLKDEIDCIRVERRGLAEVYGGFHNELEKNKKKLRSNEGKIKRAQPQIVSFLCTHSYAHATCGSPVPATGGAPRELIMRHIPRHGQAHPWHTPAAPGHTFQNMQ